jgi:hypothetical protein
MKAIRVLISIGLFFASAQASSAADSSASIVSIAQPSPTPVANLLTRVAVPCNASGQSALGLESCAVAIPRMQQNLQSRITLQVDGQLAASAPSPVPSIAGIYQGCEHSSVVAGLCKDGQPGTTVPGTVCDPVPGIFNKNTAETTTNHLGQSCGQWAQISTRTTKGRCNVSVSFDHPAHTMEESLMRGAEVRGMDCHLAQVVNEIGNQSLKLTNVGTTPSPCAAIYAQITALQSSAAQQEAALKAALVNQPNVKETELCTSKAVSSDPNNPDVGPLRQSACQLKSLQQSMEATFVQMAACEVSTRLMYSYQSFLVAPIDGKTIDQEVTKMMNQGQQGSADQCNPENILNTYYIPYYWSQYNARMKAVWNTSVCQ